MDLAQYSYNDQSSNTHRSSIIRQLSFNPLILVLALAIYVLLLLSGILGNIRVLSIIWNRLRPKLFSLDIKLVDLDIFSISLSNFISVICFTFLIFDLAYGQWLLPSDTICRIYLSLEIFSRILSSTALFHLILLSTYYIIYPNSQTESTISMGYILKIASHYLYIFIISPCLGLIPAILFFKYSTVHYWSMEIPLVGVGNLTERIPTGNCFLKLSQDQFLSMIIYQSVLGYWAPVTVFLFGFIFSYNKIRILSPTDVCLRRYFTLAKNYCILFIFCVTGEWVMSIYDYYNIINGKYQEYTVAAAYMGYIARVLSYMTCVGYPMIYLKGLSINRVASEASIDSMTREGCEQIAVSSASTQQYISRDQSRDVLLATRRPMRSRTMSNLHIARVEASINIGTERHSYQTLPDEREIEDKF